MLPIYAEDNILLGENINATKKTQKFLIAAKVGDFEANTEKTTLVFVSREHNAGQDYNAKMLNLLKKWQKLDILECHSNQMCVRE
jgi:hypothetical protein